LKLELINEHNPILKQETEKYEFGVEDSEQLVSSMLSAMTENKGVGLAAPQVGLSKSFFVMGYDDKYHNIFNPEVLTYSNNNIIYEEGCLSFPNLFFKVKRPEFVIAKYQNEKGDWIENKFDGLFGRIFLHEYDHLQGICFTDKVGKVTLDLANRRRIKRQQLEK
jgi:peptide deformylase